MKFYSLPNWVVKTALLAILFACAVSVEAYAQDPRMMLGAASQVPDKFSPKYNIRYNDAGFDQVRPKPVKKSHGYLLNHGAPAYVADSFMQVTTAIQETPDWFGQMIDKAWESRSSAFMSCGGQWANAVTNSMLSSIYVMVQPTIWQASAYGQTYWVTGEMDPTSYGEYLIKAVNVYANGILSNPAGAYLVDFGALVEWEMGNALAAAAGYHPSGVATEIGNNSPCQTH
jgi:hypothetical protein